MEVIPHEVLTSQLTLLCVNDQHSDYMTQKVDNIGLRTRKTPEPGELGKETPEECLEKKKLERMTKSKELTV